ncbi:hypothetical protein ABVT39_018173, partial [Epinephelus coioides]
MAVKILTSHKAAEHTQWNFIVDGYSRHSRLVMNGQWHHALHSDKSCKPLCLMTRRRGPRSDHPSEVPRSSLSTGRSHPR